jgi:hypothetical protein
MTFFIVVPVGEIVIQHHVQCRSLALPLFNLCVHVTQNCPVADFGTIDVKHLCPTTSGCDCDSGSCSEADFDFSLLNLWRLLPVDGITSLDYVRALLLLVLKIWALLLMYGVVTQVHVHYRALMLIVLNPRVLLPESQLTYRFLCLSVCYRLTNRAFEMHETVTVSATE